MWWILQNDIYVRFFRGPTLKVDGRIYEYGLDRWTVERMHLC